MNKETLKALIAKMDSLESKIQAMNKAINYSDRSNRKIIIGIQEETGGNPSFIIGFNKEIGIACYQAKLEEVTSELSEIKKRIGAWK